MKNETGNELTEINDLLLSAFGLALNKITSINCNYITLEGHGREEIVDHIDLTRTVGWFTTMYPVKLEVDSAADIGSGIIKIKEYLRSIPNKGLGYGALFGYDAESLPRVSFNYLGQFDQSADNSYWNIVNEGSGIQMHSENYDTNVINANGHVSDGELSFYVSGKLNQQLVSSFVDEFKHQLTLIIVHTNQQYDIFYSVNDFTDGFEDCYKQFNDSNLDTAKIIFILPPGAGGYESYISKFIPSLKNYNVIAFNNYYLHIASKIDIKYSKDIDINYLAKFYIQFIKSLQPKGPYYLFGWSFGGVVAFEVARQLEINYGDKINYLGLVDSYFNYKYVIDNVHLLEDRESFKNINYVYTMDNYFDNYSKTMIKLYKANKETLSTSTDEQKVINFYSESDNNFIECYMDNSFLDIIEINSNHNDWTQNLEVISKITEDINSALTL